MNGFVLVSLMGLVSASDALAATASPAPASLSRETSVLGKAFGVDLSLGPNAAQNGLSASLNATILGKRKSLVQATIEPSTDFKTAQLQVYVNGVQLVTGQELFKSGAFNKSFPIPPQNANATIVTVPVGPLIIQVDGGYVLNGNLGGNLVLGELPGASAPYGVAANIASSVHASGFIQGSVGLLVVRGGVQGQIDVADGNVKADSNLYFGNYPSSFSSTGSVSFFSGAVNAFADYFAFLAGWKRFLNFTFFRWNGYCFSFDSGAMTSGKCAVK